MPRTKKTDTVSAEVKKPSRRGRPSKAASKTSSRFQFSLSSLRSNIENNRQKYARYLIVIGIVVLIGLFAYWKKDWFVVGVVNREPITSVEFYQGLKAKHGEAVLREIIRDKLILQEARRQNVRVTQEDVDKKFQELEGRYGGAEGLAAALEQNNLTEQAVRDSFRILISAEKILDSKTQVSEEEIDKFIKDNPDDINVAGTDDKKGPNREAISEQLKQSKFDSEYAKWYAELEEKASILEFI
jgi:parvulin-like peptidyl-prolyl isomerase